MRRFAAMIKLLFKCVDTASSVVHLINHTLALASARESLAQALRHLVGVNPLVFLFLSSALKFIVFV